MMDKEIIEGNKLIAEFMGYENLRSSKEYPLYRIPDHSYEMDNEFGTTEIIDTFESNWDLCFDSSWDWLMPVVEKIGIQKMKVRVFGLLLSDEGEEVNLICENFSIANRWVTIKFEYFRRYYEKTYYYKEDKSDKIESVWLAVVEFIKWYNKNV